ncbi:acyltransferase [Massilia sp. RP-1-19]|uniref:Acyltransferase n=1 Tax=Massilia polaris TaxID=2728846 RepID=A0A848HIH1_9BURK|nr:acyltransferase [Massilia polaris]NML59990.1 acyltransferase [Massilia polaris]
MAVQVNAPAQRHWAAINEVSFVAGMRLLFWVWRVFGRWPFGLVLHPVLLWYVLASPRARRISAAYLARAGAFAPVPQGLAGVLRHFGAFAETILDKMLLWGGLFDTSRVRFHGIAPMQKLIDAGQGALLVCSHLGNLELCRVMAHQQAGLKLTVLVHTRHAQAFNKMLARLDPRSELNLLQVTEMTPATAMMLSERVAAGEFVVIAGDRIPLSPDPRVAHASFLGSDAAFPVGPYVMASVLQCPIYLLFCQRAQDGDYDVHFELLRESVRLPRAGRDAALTELARDYAARLEYHCLRSPLQWFNFYEFWQLPNLDKNDASC